MADYDYVGPTRMDCQKKCKVPAGMKLMPVPRPRHDWPGMLHCPNEGCGWSFLYEKIEKEEAANGF